MESKETPPDLSYQDKHLCNEYDEDDESSFGLIGLLAFIFSMAILGSIIAIIFCCIN